MITQREEILKKTFFNCIFGKIKTKMIQFWILFSLFICFCAGVESETEYDDYYEYYDQDEQEISAEWKALATEMLEGMSSNLITI